MASNAVREALHERPFEPFSLRPADGRELSVRHPDYVAVSTRRVIVIRPEDEAVSIIEPLLIVSIEYAGTSARPGTSADNGGKK